MNFASVLILIVIGAALFFSVRHSLKNGGNGCSGNCAGCPMQCQSKKEMDKKSSGKAA